MSPSSRDRRLGCGLGAFVGTLVLLFGLAVAADRVAVWLVGSGVERLLAQSVDAVDDGPEVDIEGFPFLPQLVTGIDRMRISADGVVLDGVRLTRVEAELRDVDLDTPRRAGSVQGYAELGVDDLLGPLLVAVGDRAAVDVTTDDGGFLAATAVAGVDLSLQLTPDVRDGGLVVDVTQVQVGGLDVDVAALPGGLAGPVRDLQVQVDDLPDGLELTDVTTSESGIRVDLRGRDVSLTG